MWVAVLWSMPDMKSGRMERGRPSFFWAVDSEQTGRHASGRPFRHHRHLQPGRGFPAAACLVVTSGGVFGKDHTLLLSYVLVTDPKKSYFRYLPYEICKEE